jgi:hypothetical protein
MSIVPILYPVGIESGMGWTAGVVFPAGARNFLYYSAQIGSGAIQPPNQWVSGHVLRRWSAWGPKQTTPLHLCRGQEWWTYTYTFP